MTFYGRGYFEEGEGSHYHGYEDWPQFKARAEWLKKTFKPKSVVELGAAKGFLVKHLRDIGVKAIGYDISSYACKESRGKVIHHDLTRSPLLYRGADLLVSFDFLEHIREEDLPMIFKTLQKFPAQFHMITTSEYDFGGDVTHFTSRPKQWWIDKFNENNVGNFAIIHAGEQELIS